MSISQMKLLFTCGEGMLKMDTYKQKFHAECVGRPKLKPQSFDKTLAIQFLSGRLR